MTLLQEPRITVGLCTGRKQISGRLTGVFSSAGAAFRDETFTAGILDEKVALETGTGRIRGLDKEIRLQGDLGSTFALEEVAIGVAFHWERREMQVFPGDLILRAELDGTLTAINAVPLETYLASVVSSEMSARAPLELLKAHAVASRSWLGAMLVRKGTARPPTAEPAENGTEIRRWYDREDHAGFDVCADDHCQRYQGLTKMVTPEAARAVAETRGQFLVYGGEICDARYAKACGGLSDNYATAWEDKDVPYLRSVSCAPSSFSPIRTEGDASAWIASRPDAFCGTRDAALLKRILPEFDQETTDFFRWRVTYRRQELEAILREKSGLDVGALIALVPLQRGPSGRIVRLCIEGTDRSVTVGKELEIRRWLSPTHLYSSAFVVTAVPGPDGLPEVFHLDGAGWGHGIGLCQIGAAVMADRGYGAEAILEHYFPGAAVETLYD